MDSSSVADARVAFGDTQGEAAPRAVTTDDKGFAVVRARVGAQLVRVYRVGFKRYLDSVTIRRGFSDTLRLGLGTDQICFM
jgi:hypothetical protein